jgi:hypothetical protein
VVSCIPATLLATKVFHYVGLVDIHANATVESIHKNVLKVFVLIAVLTLFSNCANSRAPYSSRCGSETLFTGATLGLEHINSTDVRPSSFVDRS